MHEGFGQLHLDETLLSKAAEEEGVTVGSPSEVYRETQQIWKLLKMWPVWSDQSQS